MKKYITQPCPCCGHKDIRVNGLWLRDVRQRAGYNQRTFGALFNPPISSPYLSDIERNRRKCPTEILDVYLEVEKTTK